MRKRSMKPFSVLSIPLLALCFSASSHIVAQQGVEPIMMVVNQLEIWPDKVDQFREIHRDAYIPASRARGTAWRVTNRTALGNTLEFSVVTPIANMAAMAAMTENGPAATEVESQLAADLWCQTVKSRRSVVLTTRPDLSMAAVPNTGLSTLVRMQVKPGKALGFASYMTDLVLPTMSDAGVVGAQMFETTLGGPAGEFWMSIPHSGVAALDAPGPFDNVTPELGMRLLEANTELLDSWETRLIYVDQELSFGLPGLSP